MALPFAELHCHTEYSNTRLIDCLNKLPDTIDHAVHMGLRGLAITDHECLSGHVKALNHVKEIRQEHPDFTLILGNEIYLCPDRPLIETDTGKTRYDIESSQFYHFILLAKDAAGHKQLRMLSSRAWDRCYSFKGIDRVPTFYSDIEEIVGSDPGHLIASTACIGGEFAKRVLADDKEGASAFAFWCKKQFGDGNFFIELQPSLQGSSQSADEQVLFNQRAVRFCQYYGIPWIITNDVHYLTRDRRSLHEIYLKSHEEEREAGDFYESTYFKTPDEMHQRLDYLPPDVVEQGFANTVLIADMCKDAGDYGLFCGTIVPKRKLPAFTVTGSLDVDAEKYPAIHAFYHSEEPQDLWLIKQLEDGMISKQQAFDETNLSRINIELEQIRQVSKKIGQPVSAYYNLTQRIVEIMWNEGGSLVGCGRGSVGGWYIAYLMDIMQLNPIKHGTHWWRHIHADRPELPDISICRARR